MAAVQEMARLQRLLFEVEREFVRTATTLIYRVGEPELKYLLCQHVWEAANHARFLRERGRETYDRVHHRAPAALAALSDFWAQLGSKVELMDAAHHDLVLAVTSHIPHLIAYTIVGTASDLEDVTQSEVIKYSAGGFRDFTRIAASDPVMWRDVFLTNKGAVLEMLGRFTEDLTAMQRAIRSADGEALFDLFTRTRAIRRSIIDEGQDTDKADFGR